MDQRARVEGTRGRVPRLSATRDTRPWEVRTPRVSLSARAPRPHTSSDRDHESFWGQALTQVMTKHPPSCRGHARCPCRQLVTFVGRKTRLARALASWSRPADRRTSHQDACRASPESVWSDGKGWDSGTPVCCPLLTRMLMHTGHHSSHGYT